MEGGPLEKGVPILLYHRFGNQVTDGMTVTADVFEAQLRYLRDQAYTVIRLESLVDDYLRKRKFPPSKSVVLTADDGHQSVYREMFPLLKKYRIPVTLFLYPSAISNASYAMTWGELREMRETGLLDFQSHTFWHPNFKQEKRKLKPAEYESFVEMQLKKSKEKLEKELGVRVKRLAWPFGLYDDELIKKAIEMGYVAAFTMEPRPSRTSDHLMALPRYLMINGDNGKMGGRFLSIFK